MRGDLVPSLLATFIIINPAAPLWQVLTPPGMRLALHSFMTANYRVAEQQAADAFVRVRVLDFDSEVLLAGWLAQGSAPSGDHLHFFTEEKNLDRPTTRRD